MSGHFPHFSDHLAPINNNKNEKHEQAKQSNIRVVCRVKPLNIFEEPIEMKIDKENAQISISQPRQQTTKTFTFNRIFTNESQQEFVQNVCKTVLKKAFENNQGFLIFSYGVTNSGKTHTILGNESEPGILPYLVKQLSIKYQVYLSAIQLYNDQFFSLVNKEKLIPRQQNGFLDFQHCAVSQIVNLQNMDQKFKQYINNRAQNDTKINSKSSRSHAIFRIRAGDVNIGVVDLAGSQRTNRVFASIDETSNINKSLLCLGRCIKALNQNTQSHLPIPYRQSKLTKVLIQYFAAKVEVLMIANINQSQACFHENMKVLDYAVLAKDIRHCSTENSLKKSEFKFHKVNKVDVFESLYRSATKSAMAHKSLKSSRSKLNQKLQKSNLNKMDANKKFAKSLKSQQLKVYIQKFDSSQQTFDYMLQYMHQQQLQDDLRHIQVIKTCNYQSPFVQNHKNKISKEFAEVAVGRSEQSMKLMKQELRQHMKEELKKLIQQERLANMESKFTSIGSSLSKFDSKCQPHIQQYSQTPMKSKQCNQQSFVMKTSSAIYSSVKKILSNKVHSLKQIIPKFSKKGTRNQKLAIHNFGQVYQSLFKIERPDEERYSQFSFYAKINKNQPKMSNLNGGNHQKQVVESSTQTSTEHEYTKESNTQQTGIETDDEGSYPSLSIYNQQASVAVRNSQLITNDDKENHGINQQDENQSSYRSQSKQPAEQIQKHEESKSKNARRNKKKQEKNSKWNDAAQRVAQTRKLASKLCRAQSRTPLKMRLRNRAKQA